MSVAPTEKNATVSGTIAAMYVPMIGMNSATNPWKSASGAAPGTPRILRTMKKSTPLMIISRPFE